jgi:uncharacterized membrane protein
MGRGFSIIIVMAIIAALYCQFAFSATISGTIYNLDLDRAKAIVEVNSVPEQRIIAVNGTYSFELPKGKYQIIAKLFNQDEYSTTENITVLDDDGHYMLDLFLFYQMPDYVEDINLNLSDNKTNYVPYIIAGIILLIIIVIVIILSYSKKKKNAKQETTEKKQSNNNEEQNLDDKIKFDILHLLKLNHGAMTQKNIRKHFDYSEAKISLIIKSLEEEGKLAKEKRGTVNFIKIK